MRFNEIKDIESPLMELNMGPKRLATEVQRLLANVTPMVGIEFEICVPGSGDNDDDNKFVDPLDGNESFEDIQEKFPDSDEDDFSKMRQEYDVWIFDKASEYTYNTINEIFDDIPNEKYETGFYAIVEIMTRYIYTTDIPDEEALLDDGEITEEVAKKILDKAHQFKLSSGIVASKWTEEDIANSPEARIFYNIFTDAKEQLFDNDELRDELEQDFFNNKEQEWKNSMGAFLREEMDTYGQVAERYNLPFYYPDEDDSTFNEGVAFHFADLIEDAFDVSVSVNTSYHGESRDNSSWIIEPDSSLYPDNGDYAMEVITPPIPYNQLEKTIKKVTNLFIENNAYTNESTGMHANVSIKGINRTDVDYVKLVLMLGDSYVGKLFGREFGEYTKTTMTQLKSTLAREKPSDVLDILDSIKSSTNRAIEKHFDKAFDFGKFTSIGLKNNRIEFRSIGNMDYIEQPELLINTINRFITVYAISADPEAYKKEYSKKLYKFLTSSVHSTGTPTSELFIKYAAGMLTRDQLITRVKRIQTTNSGPGIGFSPLLSKLAQQLSAIESMPLEDATNLLTKGVNIEARRLGKAPDSNVTTDLISKVYRNLQRDSNHYNNKTNNPKLDVSVENQ